VIRLMLLILAAELVGGLMVLVLLAVFAGYRL
jgi:hypothetical protein